MMLNKLNNEADTEVHGQNDSNNNISNNSIDLPVSISTHAHAINNSTNENVVPGSDRAARRSNKRRRT